MTTWADLHWATSVYAAPAVEPLTVSEVKAHLRLDSTDGEPAPTAPTVALVATAGNVTAGVHRWLWVARTADGQTEAGAVSAALTTILATHGKATVTKPLGGAAVTHMDLYRTAAGGSTYLLVAATANDGATYTDNIADESLGAEAPSTNTTADPYLSALIVAARELTEYETGRAWITQTRDLVLDAFPEGTEAILIPRLPLSSVTSISYVNENGATQTWSNTLYDVDTDSGRIAPASGQTYPVTESGARAAVTVRFICGYGAASSAVPKCATEAMKLLIGHWWTHREAASVGSLTDAPLAVSALLASLKV
jgi:uncharacterized phiE125 gp8 family phage protein